MTLVLFLTADAELRAGDGRSALTGVLSSKLSAVGLTTLGEASTPAAWFSGPHEPLRGAAFLPGSGVPTTSGWRPGSGLAPTMTGTG
jgi:hypothetical protein